MNQMSAQENESSMHNPNVSPSSIDNHDHHDHDHHDHDHHDQVNPQILEEDQNGKFNGKEPERVEWWEFLFDRSSQTPKEIHEIEM